MYESYPVACTSAEVNASDPFTEPVGLCACCADYCFPGGGALLLANGVLCAHCLTHLSDDALTEYVGAIAPAAWSGSDIARTVSELRN